MLHAIHNFLTNKLTILISYILINSFAKLIFSDIYHETFNMTLFGIGILVFYIILALAAYRDIKVAVWLMALCLLFSGIGTFIVGVFLTSATQYIVKIVFIITGIYFTYGGFFLIFPKWNIFKINQN